MIKGTEPPLNPGLGQPVFPDPPQPGQAPQTASKAGRSFPGCSVFLEACGRPPTPHTHTLTLVRVGGGQDGAVFPLHLLHILRDLVNEAADLFHLWAEVRCSGGGNPGRGLLGPRVGPEEVRARPGKVPVCVCVRGVGSADPRILLDWGGGGKEWAIPTFAPR